ncbi:MAG: hypothetical protein QOD75_1236 [Blastocatellia bacterium]|nr:hypothetical protein [Blastocatellia bacterium]
MRKYPGWFFRPLSKQISRARYAASVIAPHPLHGLKLLMDGMSEPYFRHQPDVYSFAAYLGERFECTHVIAMGRPVAKDLLELYPTFEIIGIVPRAEQEFYRGRYKFATWLDQETSLDDPLVISAGTLQSAVIVCHDLEQFPDPEAWLRKLKLWLAHAPVCILTAADRDLVGNDGSPTQGRWNLRELESLLRSAGFNPEFIGWTASDNVAYEKKSILAVVTNEPPVENRMRPRAPLDFRVVAFMAAYNEEDIIVQSIKKWTDQGVSVHVLENWSTDATYDLAKELETHLPLTVERFPPEGPSDYFDWGAMLQRMEALSTEIEADWFIRRGADEVLTPPWPDMSYRDALYLVDQAGYNCVDHTIVEFHPVDDGFRTGMDHETYFRHFDFKNLSHPNQRKAWKNLGQPISTINSAGHDVLFAGRRVYPFKFLLKHYSFRSQAHGERKVFRERKARWNPKERARGWHIHYDSMKEGHSFVRAPAEKEIFDDGNFHETYLVERLSGIGTQRKAR